MVSEQRHREDGLPHDPKTLRRRTVDRVEALGFTTPPEHLPYLWEAGDAYELRPIDEIVARAAILNVVLARSFGMPAELGRSWIEKNGLSSGLSRTEDRALDEPESYSGEIQMQVEAIWALAWVLGLAPKLNPSQLCEDKLVTLLPNLKLGEPLAAWAERARSPRTADEVMEELDLYYCLTWALANANLTGKPAQGVLGQYVYWERRRALEWAMAADEYAISDWDGIDLST